jgi:DnaJ-class molecular chaperone
MKIDCPACNGAGTVDESKGMAEYRICPECDGDGLVEED